MPSTPLDTLLTLARIGRATTVRQMVVLFAVAEAGGKSSRAYMKRTGLSAPVVSRSVTVLETMGLVQNTIAEDDRRCLAITLTPRGAKLVAGLGAAA